MSNASDLATFIRLAHGELLPDATYAEMIQWPARQRAHPRSVRRRPALGNRHLQQWSVPGFTAYMQYDPATEDLFVLLLNDDTRSPDNSATTCSRSSATAEDTA